jgi:hypothetical protein
LAGFSYVDDGFHDGNSRRIQRSLNGAPDFLRPLAAKSLGIAGLRERAMSWLFKPSNSPQRHRERTLIGVQAKMTSPCTPWIVTKQ